MVTLQGTGVWAGQFRYGDPGETRDGVAELEALGYTAAWIPDVGGDDLYTALDNILGATTRFVAATGVLNLWMHPPQEAATQHARLTRAHGDRLLVGIGVSHSKLIDRESPGRYAKPVDRMNEFLDGLDGADPPLPVERRVLAALGPRMLTIARERARGAHPYLATPEHTARAREVLGTGKLLAPEQGVVLETDPERARSTARAAISYYFELPNYVNNWRRLGFTEDDVAAGGSDRLIDALVAWGDEETIARRVQEHKQAGADHVCVQVLATDRTTPLEQLRRLAPAVT